LYIFFIPFKETIMDDHMRLGKNYFNINSF